jgi:hypothetical protein
MRRLSCIYFLSGRIRAHFLLAQKTGLSAPIQRILLCKIRKDFRYYPLRAHGPARLRLDFFAKKRII